MTVSKSHFPHSFHPRKKFLFEQCFFILYFYLYIFQFIDLQYLYFIIHTNSHAYAGLTLLINTRNADDFQKFFQAFRQLLAAPSSYL